MRFALIYRNRFNVLHSLRNKFIGETDCNLVLMVAVSSNTVLIMAFHFANAINHSLIVCL